MTDSVADTLRALRAAAHLLPDGNGAEASATAEISSTASDDELWNELAGQLPDSLAGRRVLVVGAGTERVAHGFAARDALHVLRCQTGSQGEGNVLEAADGSSVDSHRLPWSALDPAVHGTFDIVHCHHLLEHVPDPVSLLRTVRDMTASEGTLFCRLLMLDDPERSEYLRYIPDRLAGDPAVWFVPGRLAIRWLLQEAGFTVEEEFGQQAGPSERFPTVSAYLRCMAG